MGYVIQNDIEVSVFFSDVEYPLSEINVLNYLLMTENAISLVPTLTLSVFDQSQIFKNLDFLQDAAPIRVVIKAYNDEERTYRFRLFRYTIDKNPSGDQYTIHAYYDSVQYWLGRLSRSIHATSSNAIAQIARQCGLEFIGDETNDKQLWLPANRTNAAFVKYISKSGWSNPRSYMVCGLNLQGQLLYKDLSRNRPIKARFHRGEFRRGLVPVTQHEPATNSGLNNITEGYRSRRYPQGAAVRENRAIDELQFTPDSTRPLLNQKVRSEITSAHRFGKICFGNNHPNREHAIYQNQRYASLYSYGDSLLTPMPTNVTLFDNINFTSVVQANAEEDTGNSGRLIITAKAIYIAGASYYEKHVGVRHGTNQEQ